MALSAAVTPKRPMRKFGSFVRRVLTASVQAYAGGAYSVDKTSGKLKVPVGDTATEVFAGWADENLLGDGIKLLKLHDDCEIQLAVTGVTGPKDEGKVVYCTDDGTFSLTDSGSDLPVGKVGEHVSSTTCWVVSKRTALT